MGRTGIKKKGMDIVTQWKRIEILWRGKRRKFKMNGKEFKWKGLKKRTEI